MTLVNANHSTTLGTKSQLWCPIEARPYTKSLCCSVLIYNIVPDDKIFCDDEKVLGILM